MTRRLTEPVERIPGESLDSYADRVVATAPPLSPEKWQKIGRLLGLHNLPPEVWVASDPGEAA